MYQAEHHRFSDDFSGLADLLFEGGLILHPTDTFWSVSAALPHADKLLSLPIDQNSFKEGLVLMVRDIPMMKQYVTDLHPRVETLLHYHDRPLIVLGNPPRYFPEWMLHPLGKLAVLIAKNEFCLQLIRALKGPIVSVPAFKHISDGPYGFGRISSDIIEQIDYIKFNGGEPENQMEDCPMIRYDHKGNIHFVRE